MTEFLICASFFLVPLFLGTQLLAKYIDIKQANVQAARYQAWEYTVWYANDTVRGIDYSTGRLNNGGEVMSGFKDDQGDPLRDNAGIIVRQPVKSTARTRNESRQRFYINPGNEDTTAPIRATDADTNWTPTGANYNPLWTDPRSNRPLLLGGATNGTLQSSAATPTIPVIGDIMNVLLKTIGFIFGAMGDLMDLVGSPVGFNAINTNGYANAYESIRVANSLRYQDMKASDSDRRLLTLSTTAPLNFATRAAVLSDAWNAGGADQVYNQAGGTVPTTLLNGLLDKIPGFDEIWAVVSLLAPELALCNPPFTINSAQPHGSLWLGHIDIDAVHPDRLIADPTKPDERNGTHVCEDGFCDFVPVVPRPHINQRECRG